MARPCRSAQWVITEKDVENAKAMLAGHAKKHRNGGGAPKARPIVARPVHSTNEATVIHAVPTTADRAGRITLAGLKAAAEARKRASAGG
jgi:hypothetical protein